MADTMQAGWRHRLIRYGGQWLLDVCMRQHCRVTPLGCDQVPATGGALLVGNHGAWLDGLIVGLASPRPVHFVIPPGHVKSPLLKRWLLAMGAIFPPASDPLSALPEIHRRVAEGHLVCCFPEGRPTHNGQLHPLLEEYWQPLPESTPLIPFSIQGSWGSQASRASSRLKRIRGRGWLRQLTVAFGEPLAPSTPVERVKRRMHDQAAVAWNHFAGTLPSLPAAWLRAMKYSLGQPLLKESSGEWMKGRELVAGVIPLAQQMARIAAGPQLALLIPTSAQGMMTYLAALLAGKRVMCINHTSSVDTIRSTLEQAEVTTVFVLEGFQHKLEQRGLRLADALKGYQVEAVEPLLKQSTRSQRLALTLAFHCLPAALLDRLYAPSVVPAEAATLLFSSGSEGAPKGVVLSHHNILANVYQTTDTLNPAEDEVILASLPLFHAFGLTVTQFLPLLEGLPVVVHPDPTDVVGLAQAIARHRVTFMCGTSTFFRLFVRNRRVEPAMLASLREIWAGAERLRAEVRESFRLKFQKAIYEGYGVTETSPVTSVNRSDYYAIQEQRIIRGDRQGTVGMPAIGTSYRIGDPDSWEELATGEEGMILVSGPQLMLGYLQDPESTAQVMRTVAGTHWYATGDKGRLDHDGALTIVDRYSRFAKIGGEMISLAAVERAVTDALGDSGIGVMAVNLADPHKGEIVVALFEQEVEPATLRKQMSNAGHHPLMMPAHCIKVEALPHLGTGKADFTTAKRMVEEHFQR